MKNNSNFDEKQILDRGKAFQVGFLAAIFTICAMFFLTDVCGVTMTHYSFFLIALWIPLTVCFILLIAKDAYENVNCLIGKTVLSIYGLAGVFIMVSTLIPIAALHEHFFSHGSFTDSLGHFITAVCMIATCAVYWIKYFINKNKYREE